MPIGTKLELRRRVPAACAGEWAAERPGRRSLARLQETLRRATEMLAAELAHPGNTAPAWSQVEWAVARAVAAIHGISPLLADLPWQGPLEWVQFLKSQRAHTAQRSLRIERLLRLVDERAREAAIAVLPLKGAALHALGLYVGGERPMADIDLLVREEQLPRCSELLATIGFTEIHRTWKHRVFAGDDDAAPAALGEDAGNSIKIELHCGVAEPLPRRRVDITRIVIPEPFHPGFNPYPSKTALLLHLLLHAAGALVLRSVRLLQLHDIARLAAVMNVADWEQLSLLAARTPERSLWWAFPPLELVNRYVGGVPQGVLLRAAADCPWVLRRVYRRRALAEVSLSHLWVSAFPGIEWTRSLRAMLEYVAARAVPDGETLQQREAAAKVQPRVSGGSWSHLTQRERVVRWIISRPARHETLQPVRAALRWVPA